MAFLPRAERGRIARLRTLAIPAAVPVQAAWGRAQDIRSSRLASSPRPITTRLKGIALVVACVLAFGTQTVPHRLPPAARVGSIASIARMSAGRPRGIRQGRDVRIGTHLVGFDDGLTGAGFGLAGRAGWDGATGAPPRAVRLALAGLSSVCRTRRRRASGPKLSGSARVRAAALAFRVVYGVAPALRILNVCTHL